MSKEPVHGYGVHNSCSIHLEHDTRRLPPDFLAKNRRNKLPKEDARYSDEDSLITSLKTCAKAKDLSEASSLHALLPSEGCLAKNIETALLNTYSRYGALGKAQEAFRGLLPDGVCWSVLIAGYVQHGYNETALKHYEQMQHYGIPPDAPIFTCILKACGSLGASDKGKEIHAEVVKQGLLETNVILGTALVDMYAKCGELAEAQDVFDKLSVRNIVSWSALIAGYALQGQGDTALECFKQMQDEGLSPNAVTFTCILKACGGVGAVDKGNDVHSEIVRQGLLGKDVILGTALVDMYARCGALIKAQEVLSKLPIQSVATWNALITGFAEHGPADEALNCFERMQQEHLSPDEVTFTLILKACGNIGAVKKGNEIHNEIVRNGFLLKYLMLGNALLNMYLKCDFLVKAEEVFHKLPVRNVVSWSILIAGYVQHGHADIALSCYEQMQEKGLSPDVVTFTCILRACGNIGAAKNGKQVHDEVVRRKILARNVLLGTALVDMYAKCGLLAMAQRVFDELQVRDTVSWNVLAAGYAQQGHGNEVLGCLQSMQQDGFSLDIVTFTVLLSACSHSGLEEDAQLCFRTMNKLDIVPTFQLHACMVDLLGRAGCFDKVISLIEKLSACDCHSLWFALLTACQKWGNVGLGRLAFECMVHLNEKDAAAYVCMSNMYAAIGVAKKVEEIEFLRVKAGV